MLISEMHIALEQELDSINVNIEDNFEDEQKDFFLNREIQNFVKTRVRSLPITGGVGLDDVMKRLIDIETLVEREVPLATTILTDGDVEGPLLPDCYYPIAFGADINCTLTVPQESTPKYMVRFPFKRDPELWNRFKITATGPGGTGTMFDITDYEPYKDGMQDVYQDYVVLDLVITRLNSLPNVEAYWQYYDGVFYPNEIIIIDQFANTSATFEYIGDVITKNYEDVSKTTYQDVSGFVHKYGRLYSVEFIRQNIDTSFNTTFAHSPLGSINKELLHIYTKKKFIVRGAYLTYVRTPQIVSLSLNNSCDLPDAIHDEIVKLTAKSIKAIIDSSNYEKTLTETSLIN